MRRKARARFALAAHGDELLHACPRAASRPCAMIPTRSASSSTSDIWWVEKSTARPRSRASCDEAVDRLAAHDVQPQRGLVQHQRRRVVDMARAMETRCRCPVESLPQRRSAKGAMLEALDHLLHPRRALPAAEALQVGEVGEQLPRREPLVQPHGGGEEARGAGAPPAARVTRRSPSHACVPAVGPQQRGQAAQRGGLAGAVGAQQRVHLPALHAQREAVDGEQVAVATSRVDRSRSFRA